MRKFFSCWIVLSLFFSSTSSLAFPNPAPELGPHRLLRKLSQRVRGVDPSPAETLALKSHLAMGGKVSSFIANKTSEYVASAEYQTLMHARVREMLNQNAEHVPASLQGNPYVADSERRVYHLSTGDWIKKVIEQDLPWDQLITGKQWKSFPNATYAKDGELYSGFLSAEERAAGKEMNFSSTDSRWAGVLTTAGFRVRNMALAPNQNRRLAAATLRAFLCDDMQIQVVPGNAENQDRNVLNWIKNLFQSIPLWVKNFVVAPDRLPPATLHAYPQKNQRTLASGDPHQGFSPEFMADPHGTNPACIACHEKLDPVGLTFGTPGTYAIGTSPSAGALVLRRNGVKMETPVAGIGDLAQAITEQPEYSACQVKRFWGWIIGEDIAITSTLQNSLIQTFNSDRKPSTLIAALTATDEFKIDRSQSYFQIPTDPPPTWAQVQPIFERCNDCHAPHGISMSQRPWGGSQSSDPIWLDRIYDRLGLGSAPQTMPLNASEWTAEEMDLMKRFIAHEKSGGTL